MSKYEAQKRYKLKIDLIEKYGSYCIYCNKSLVFEDIVTEHIIPKSRGGSDNIENQAISCHSCNSSKNSLCLEEWLEKNILYKANAGRTYRYRSNIVKNLRKMLNG